jgi:steroid Delta-isomerase
MERDRMKSQESSDRVAQHVAAFNAAVRSGDWSSFAGRFTPDAAMRFIGVPAGPFAGRAAIAEAYARQPPTDTMSVQQADSAGAVDTVRFGWHEGGGGVMRLSWQDELIASLDVTFGGWPAGR